MSSPLRNTHNFLIDESFGRNFDEEFENSFNEWLHDCEQNQEENNWRKSIWQAYIERGRDEGKTYCGMTVSTKRQSIHVLIFNYDLERTRRNSYMHIVDRLSNEIGYFHPKQDATERLGSPHYKSALQPYEWWHMGVLGM